MPTMAGGQSEWSYGWPLQLGSRYSACAGAKDAYGPVTAGRIRLGVNVPNGINNLSFNALLVVRYSR